MLLEFLGHTIIHTVSQLFGLYSRALIKTWQRQRTVKVARNL